MAHPLSRRDQPLCYPPPVAASSPYQEVVEQLRTEPGVMVQLERFVDDDSDATFCSFWAGKGSPRTKAPIPKLIIEKKL